VPRPSEKAEKLRSAQPCPDGFLVGWGAHQAGHSGHGRVDRGADRPALLAHQLVIALDPFGGFFRGLESEAERTHPEPGGEHHGFAPRGGDPDGWMRLLQRFWDNVAYRHSQELAAIARVRLRRHHLQALAGGLFPHLLF